MDTKEIANLAQSAIIQYDTLLEKTTEPDWLNLSSNERDLYCKAVNSVQSNTTPNEFHSFWFLYKKSSGWRRGFIYNSSMMTHPDLFPYNDLPKDIQLRVKLVLSIIKTLKFSSP